MFILYHTKLTVAREIKMIYQVCDLDKKILQKRIHFLQYFLVEVRRIELLSNERNETLSTSLVYR